VQYSIRVGGGRKKTLALPRFLENMGGGAVHVSSREGREARSAASSRHARRKERGVVTDRKGRRVLIFLRRKAKAIRVRGEKEKSLFSQSSLKKRKRKSELIYMTFEGRRIWPP